VGAFLSPRYSERVSIRVFAVKRPDWRSPGAQAHWPEVVKQSADAGVLTELNWVALAQYLRGFVLWRDANEKVAKFGAVVKGAAA